MRIQTIRSEGQNKNYRPDFMLFKLIVEVALPNVLWVQVTTPWVPEELRSSGRVIKLWALE